MMLTLAYEYGGINLNAGYVQLIAMTPFRYLDVYLKHPTLPNFSGWLQTGSPG